MLKITSCVSSIFLAAALAAIGITPARASLVTGNIAVYNAAGTTLIGYVSDIYDGQDTFTYTTNIANALSVEIDPAATTPFAVLEANPPGSHDYFGAVGGSGGYDFTASGDGYAYLTGSALVAAGSTPAAASNDLQVLGYNAPDESSIWSLTGDVLTGQWVNSDSTVVNPVQTFYDPFVDYLGITGDLSAYNSTFGDSAQAVTFEFTGALPTATPEPGTGALLGMTLAAVGFFMRRRKA